jgi:hypothetical protein
MISWLHRRLLPGNAGWLLVWMFSACLGPIRGATLSDPAVEGFNIRIGSQIFAPNYHFTTNSALWEAGDSLREMGSDVIKFAASKAVGPYGITLPGSVYDLATLARNEPSYRHVLDLPFHHYVLWTYCFSSPSDAYWKSGISPSQRQNEYNEIYAFATYLLTNYNNSGKSFYLGHWEGDWYLLPNYNAGVNPSAQAIAGMIDWLNLRQLAVDDARRDHPHTNVSVYVYTEANRVRDAMVNDPSSNQRVINMVVPGVTNLDFVSWSSYDGMDLPAGDLWATLNYLEAHLSTNKAAAIPGRRVFISEYGWGGTQDSNAQEPLTRAYLQKLLPWSPRFILFWQLYDNEAKAYWLIDSNHVKTPCYYLHENLANSARLLAAQFKETSGRLPTDAEFSNLTTPLLNAPLSAPVPLTVSNLDLSAVSATSATLNGRVAQGVYGDDQAAVRVCWGTTDGGTVISSWNQSAVLGVNTNFNPAVFSACVTNLAPRTTYYYRFYATNAHGGTWAAATSTFSTDVLDPQPLGYRAKVAFAGYNRPETLVNFPVLIQLGTNIPGFSYRQFASRTGGDLRFTDFTGARVIPHEIDEWNTNGTSSVWVRVPKLAGTNDCVWAFWGNPAATNPPASSTNGSVWSQSFELVWHLKESAFPFADSAAKHPGTAGTLPASTPSGWIGRGVVFNGTSSYVNAGAINLGNEFTLSGWVKLDAAASSIRTLWGSKTGGSATAGFALYANSWGSTDQKLLLETGNGSAAAYAATDTGIVTAGQWRHVAVAINRAAGTAQLFVDGTDRTSSSSTLTDFANQNTVYLGRFADAGYYFKGSLDEVRLETNARSSNWIWAAWMTTASNAAFTAYAPTQAQRPQLSASASNSRVSLLWPGSGVGFGLYTATNINPPAWTLATNQAALTNGQWQILLPANLTGSRFYRLAQ